MVQRSKQPRRFGENPTAFTSGADAIVQIKVWLLGVSPMVWRRVLVPVSLSLRELYGVTQVAKGWEGIHLYQFRPWPVVRLRPGELVSSRVGRHRVDRLMLKADARWRAGATFAAVHQ